MLKQITACSMNRLAPRIKHHRNGTCTVSGIQSIDMRSIMTAAFLWRNQEKDKISEGSQAWDRRIRYILEVAKPPPYRIHCADTPVSQLSKQDVYYRMRDVKEARSQRLHVEKIMEEIFKGKKNDV